MPVLFLPTCWHYRSSRVFLWTRTALLVPHKEKAVWMTFQQKCRRQLSASRHNSFLSTGIGRPGSIIKQLTRFLFVLWHLTTDTNPWWNVTTRLSGCSILFYCRLLVHLLKQGDPRREWLLISISGCVWPASNFAQRVWTFFNTAEGLRQYSAKYWCSYWCSQKYICYSDNGKYSQIDQRRPGNDYCAQY